MNNIELMYRVFAYVSLSLIHVIVITDRSTKHNSRFANIKYNENEILLTVFFLQ